MLLTQIWGDLGQLIAAGRQEVEVLGVRDHVVFGLRQQAVDDLGVVGLRQHRVPFRAPELHRDSDLARPAGAKAKPRAGAATTAALMRGSWATGAGLAGRRRAPSCRSAQSKKCGCSPQWPRSTPMSGSPPMAPSTVKPPEEKPKAPILPGVEVS